MRRSTALLLNLAHAIDHMFLMIFATAVTAIASEFGIARWEDLMPFGVAAFFLFGIGSMPAGRLGDLWGRRPMMLVFFVGMGVSALLAGMAQSPMQLALALALLGAFASIYHPVGIPMLLQGARRPGWVIGVNGLSGNLGLAAAAIVTGFLVKHLGWRAAFMLPGAVCLACALLFAWLVPAEAAAPARKKAAPGGASVPNPHGMSLRKLLFIMTLAATSNGLLFNLSTNANYELLADRLITYTRDPAVLGGLLAGVYAVSALSQLVVGRMLDRWPLKRLFLSVIVFQGLCLALASQLSGWWFFAIQFLFMAAIFGAIPFSDALIARYVDDSVRSRVSGMRLAVSLGASSLAVWALGPLVKQMGFSVLLAMMAVVSVLTFSVATRLPGTPSPQA